MFQDSYSLRSWTAWALLVSASAAHADLLKVGASEAHLTIQSALSAAAPGDTIEVSAGLYVENVRITKQVIFKGAKAGIDARGRGTSADPLVETVIAPASGHALEISAAGGAVEVDGLTLSGVPAGADAAVVVSASLAAGFHFRDNLVLGGAGSTVSTFAFEGGAEDATLEQNVFISSAGPSTVSLDGAHSYNGLRFLSNHVTRVSTVSGNGLWVDGPQNVASSTSRAPRIAGNRFSGHAVGLNGGGGSFSGVEIEDNVFQGNQGGLAAGIRSGRIAGNTWDSNSVYGLKLTSFGASTDPAKGARDTVIEGNFFTGNGSVVNAGDFGDVVVDDEADGLVATLQFRRNRFTSGQALFSNEPDGSIDAAFNYWGHASGPAGIGAGSGSIVSSTSPVDYRPFYRDAALQSLNFGGATLNEPLVLASSQSIAGDSLVLGADAVLTIGPGAWVEVGSFSLQPNANVVVKRGSLKLEALNLAAGAELQVVNGELSLDPLGSGEFHTIAGTFSFFNCLGSIHIDGDTSFTGATLGIVSDIHVASGVTLTVAGSLSLDGCSLDGSGYTLQADPGSNFSLIRSEFTGANLVIGSNTALVSDNVFRDSSVVVSAAVSGAKVYHNVFADGLQDLEIQSGAVVTTAADGWGNVTSLAAVKNSLGFHVTAPLGVGRTQAADGSIYLQPGDALSGSVGISKLLGKAQGVEAVLGYSTDFLSLSSAASSGDWTQVLHHAQDASGVIGRIGRAAGLDLALPDRSGSDADGDVLDLSFQTTAIEGSTRLFFREKDGADHALTGTRITGGGADPVFWTPFTRNSPLIVVDGTAPVVAPLVAVNQSQPSGTIDLLGSGAIAYQGVVSIQVDVKDDLAGIDPEDVKATLVGTVSTENAVVQSQQVVTLGSDTYTRYHLEWPVTEATVNGAYAVQISIADRSGNATALSAGTIEVRKNQVSLTIRLEGVDTPSLTRTVVLVATDSSGSILRTWSDPVVFTNGSADIILAGVPDGTAGLSAKSGWTLRRKIAFTQDSQGQSNLAFAGAASLLGGDLNGDNVVNLFDYQMLSSTYFTADPIADITGDGFVNLVDFGLLRSSYFIAGDAP